MSGARTTELPDAMFATENEVIARAKLRELFDLEVERYLSDYWHIASATEGDMMIVRAPEHDRFVGIGLIDELRPGRTPGIAASESIEHRVK